VFFASPRERGGKRHTEPVRDLSPREVLCLTPLVMMIFWIGLQPRFFLDRMGTTLDKLMEPAMQAVEEQGKKGTSRESRSMVKPQAAIEDYPSINNQQSSIDYPRPTR
jgi:hypothetical protein